MAKPLIYAGRAALIFGLLAVFWMPPLSAWVNKNPVLSVLALCCLAPFIVKLFPGVEDQEVDILLDHDFD